VSESMAEAIGALFVRTAGRYDHVESVWKNPLAEWRSHRRVVCEFAVDQDIYVCVYIGNHPPRYACLTSIVASAEVVSKTEIMSVPLVTSQCLRWHSNSCSG
jgi:hypothetical protein